MRFSNHQQLPASDPARERGRRKAKFVGDVKSEIKEAAASKGLNLVKVSAKLGCNKSVVSRVLDSSTNVEIFTLFEFAEALDKEWEVKLVDRKQDLACVLTGVAKGVEHFRTSWEPVIPKPMKAEPSILGPGRSRDNPSIYVISKMINEPA